MFRAITQRALTRPVSTLSCARRLRVPSINTHAVYRSTATHTGSVGAAPGAGSGSGSDGGSGGSGSGGETPPDAEVIWPIAGGAVLITSVLLGALALRSDSSLRRMNSWVEHVHKAGMKSDTVTLSWLLRVAIAFGTTQLPVQSLRQRGLRLGGLSAWSGMLGSFDLDYEQQQIALGALCALLESDEAIEMFTQETSWYDMLVRALPALVHESSESLSVPDILFDTLHLSCVIVYHPMFSHAPNDGWLWERVLEQSARVVQYEPGAALHWACLAAALADKHEVTVAQC